MMKLKDVRSAGKKTFSVVLEKDGDEETITLREETVVKHGLFLKDTLDEKELGRIRADDAFHKALAQAYDLLARRDYASTLLRKKLAAHGKRTVDRVMKHLEDEGYVDDAKTLRIHFEDALAHRTDGPKKLRERFLREGYPQALVDDVLAAYDEETQSRKAREYIMKTKRTLPAITPRKAEERLLTAGLRQGFDYEILKPLAYEARVEIEQETDVEALITARIAALRAKYGKTDAKAKERLIRKLLGEGFAYDLIRKHLD